MDEKKNTPELIKASSLRKSRLKPLHATPATNRLRQHLTFELYILLFQISHHQQPARQAGTSTKAFQSAFETRKQIVRPNSEMAGSTNVGPGLPGTDLRELSADSIIVNVQNDAHFNVVDSACIGFPLKSSPCKHVRAPRPNDRLMNQWITITSTANFS